ncbi:MAG TPA: integrase core domain-containing protein [Eudoraea sp.]|nr:integrase core domain-containing protein [Eudoraea sp.]
MASQFTSEVFTHYVLSSHIKLAMDGKGRAIDNVFIERLWRSVKYESIYLNPPESGIELYHQMDDYFIRYNTKRRHQGIDNQILAEHDLAKQQKAA